MRRQPTGSLPAFSLVVEAQAAVEKWLPPDAGAPLLLPHVPHRERVVPVPHAHVRLVLFAIRVANFLLRQETQLALMPFLAFADFRKKHRRIPSPGPGQCEANPTDPRCRPGRKQSSIRIRYSNLRSL